MPLVVGAVRWNLSIAFAQSDCSFRNSSMTGERSAGSDFWVGVGLDDQTVLISFGSSASSAGSKAAAIRVNALPMGASSLNLFPRLDQFPFFFPLGSKVLI